MRTLVHLSDIHFGAIDALVIRPLIESVWAQEPHAVVVSGDLTQRARSSEFRQARMFLDSLPAPQIVVPGNHDIPLHNVYHRFLKPLKKYRRYITEDLTPTYGDDEMMIVGLNTARSLTIKGGRINHEQIGWIGDQFCSVPETTTKILVTHHPFDGATIKQHEIVGRADRAMETLAQCGADLLLSGHLHVGHTTSTAIRYNTGSSSALVVQAGTATSTRERGEDNSYNVLRLDTGTVTIERHVWQRDSHKFAAVKQETFRRTAQGWLAV